MVPGKAWEKLRGKSRESAGTSGGQSRSAADLGQGTGRDPVRLPLKLPSISCFVCDCVQRIAVRNVPGWPFQEVRSNGVSPLSNVP